MILTDHDAANYVKYAAIRSVCTNTHQLCVHSGAPLRQIPLGPTKIFRCREGVLWSGVYYNIAARQRYVGMYIMWVIVGIQ